MPDTNGHNLDSLREQTRLHRARSRLAAAKAEADIVESFASPGALSFGADWSTILNPFQSYQHDSFFGMGWMHDAGGIHGKQDGRYHPFLWTDTDLDRQRSFARWLATKNGVAQGALRTLTNFIVKTGYTWEVAPAKPYRESPEVVQLAAQVQEVIDEFSDTNGLPQRERSAVNRAVRDGEVITRTFDIEEQTILRFVEPEQLREPPGAEPNCALGVETDPMDVEDVWQYWVTYDGTEFDAVSAADVQHLKRNVDECVKRGLSDFLSTGELIDGIARLIRNMGAGAAASSAIAWIEQFKQTTATQASQHLAAIKDLRRPIIQHPLTGRDLTTQQLQPGTVVKVDENREYLPPPSASNTQQYVEIVQAMMRFAGARWNMAEYMISGDSSNSNYASTLVAGSPFVSSIECEQDFFGQFFLKWRWIAVRNACRHGRIEGYSFTQVQRLIDIHYTPPQVAVANEGERAQVDHQDIAAGVMSLQTRRKRIGLDDEQELANLKKEPPTRVSGQATDIDAMGNPVQPDGSPEANGGQGMLQGSMDAEGRESVTSMLGESLEPTWDDLQEAVAQKRKVGDVWQGPSGRWFTVSQSGRVVPAKNPHAEVKKPKAKKEPGAEKEGSRLSIPPGQEPYARTRKKLVVKRPAGGLREMSNAELNQELTARKQHGEPVFGNEVEGELKRRREFASMWHAQRGLQTAEQGRQEVEKELAAGHEVPSEVLAYYPDVKPAGPKKPKAAKAAKADPEAVKGRVKEMLAAGKVSKEDAAELAGHLQGLTVTQLTQLKKDLGLKASGTKAVYAQKLAERALAAVGKQGPEMMKEPAAAKEPKVKELPADLDTHILTNVEKLLADKYADAEMVPIHDLRKEIAQQFGEKAASREVFDRAMMRLRADDKLHLVAASDLSQFTPEQLENSIQGMGEVFTSVRPTREQAPAAVKAEPTRETAASSLSSAIQAAAKGAGDLPDTPYGPAMAPRLTGDIGKDLRQLAQIDTSHLDQRYKQMNATGHYKGNNEVFRRLNDEFSKFKSSSDRGMPVAADEIHQAMDAVATRFAQAGTALGAMGEKKLSDYYTTHGAAMVKAARDHALAHFVEEH